MDMKDEIIAKVGQIDSLHREIADHWSMVQKCVTERRTDDAITLLNAYFRVRTQLNQVESSLESILKSYFSGK